MALLSGHLCFAFGGGERRAVLRACVLVCAYRHQGGASRGLRPSNTAKRTTDHLRITPAILRPRLLFWLVLKNEPRKKNETPNHPPLKKILTQHLAVDKARRGGGLGEVERGTADRRRRNGGQEEVERRTGGGGTADWKRWNGRQMRWNSRQSGHFDPPDRAFRSARGGAVQSVRSVPPGPVGWSMSIIW